MVSIYNDGKILAKVNIESTQNVMLVVNKRHIIHTNEQ